MLDKDNVVLIGHLAFATNKFEFVKTFSHSDCAIKSYSCSV